VGDQPIGGAMDGIDTRARVVMLTNSLSVLGISGVAAHRTTSQVVWSDVLAMRPVFVHAGREEYG
jgi:hypothetical protein